MGPVILFCCALALSWALTGLLLRALKAAAHHAAPNDRSMHTVPTPVGGGLAIIAAVLVLVPLWRWPLGRETTTVLMGAALLSLVSAIDHYRPLWPLTRLLAQAVAVAIVLALLPDTTRFVADLPLWVERVGLGLAWLWLINLTNFMDGIDGIAGAEGAAVAIGVAAVCALHFADTTSAEVFVATALAGACLGYLVWNWAPARIFMGDAGSIPIGFLLGWLLLSLAAKGAWAAAIILPLLFVADASITLVRRILSGAKPWHPHRMHFYQRAVQGSATAAHIVLLLTVCNACLIAAALLPMRQPVAVLAAGLLIAWFFLMFLARWASSTSS